MRDHIKEWLFISLSEGQVCFAEGPFKRQKTIPAGATAFYYNDFELSSPTPWLIPSALEYLTPAELTERLASPQGEPHQAFQWQEPDPSQFAAIFGAIASSIADNTLKKSVPVVTESAPCTFSEFLALIENVFSAPANMYPYGGYIDGKGFLGASPEFLFRSFEGKLNTMALAGTAQQEERAVFNFDQKEIQEHEFVAQTLLDRLTPLGMIKRDRRKVLDLGSLIHFHTAIEVELYQSHEPDYLIRHLHPTPALGPLPRTPETMQQLIAWRRQLGCPAYFGAPFGLYHQGHLDLLVAIRMLAYEAGLIMTPAGCGIIEASRLTNEWRELKLKRISVQNFLGHS